MAIHPSFSLKKDLLHTNVIYSVTVTAEEVMMGFSIIVVMGLAALDGHLLNEPVLFKEIKGVVDRGPGEGGIQPPEGLVDLFGRGMLGVAVEKVKDRGPLNGE